ncbi:hypothetical protein ACBJ59_49015 [Nonomuraea sp. MTCD27]|uniref:hypothetical protein n=1 Tax=Nonomuraea sp. MTCD27 TaxID=1676747 RepID=UPI0035BFF852
MDNGGIFLRVVDITAVLDTVLTTMRAVGADITYRLGGTSAALLQGVQLPVGDIDLLAARREDVDKFCSALASFPCLHTASWLPESSQYFARYEVHRVKVEISTVEREVDSDGMECVGRAHGSTTCGSRVARTRFLRFGWNYGWQRNSYETEQTVTNPSSTT